MADCRNHPGIIATGRCAGCAEEFCPSCLVDIQGQKYCGSCKVMVLQGKTPGAVMAVQERAALETSKAAKEALTMSIISIFCFGFILGPVSIYKGVQAKNEIAANPNLGGGGMATAAIIIGIVSTILNVIGIMVKVASLSH